MKNYSKPVSVLARIAEAVFWISTALMLVLLVWSLFNSDLINTMFFGSDPSEYGLTLTLSSMDILGLTVSYDFMNAAVFRTMMIYGAIVMSLCAMIARNIALISKSLSKDSGFSDENTPFSQDNVRMIREIGIFSISVSLLGLVFSWILRLILQNAGLEAEVSAGTGGLFLGLVVLYLSTIFQYGVSLQKDVEGLV